MQTIDNTSASAEPPATPQAWLIRLLQEMEKQRKEMQDQHAEALQLRSDVNLLLKRVAQLQSQIRPGWDHTAAPTMDDLPIDLRPTEQHLAVSAPPPIKRVTFDQYQVCRAYDFSDRLIPSISGPFRDKGRRLLALTGKRLKWEQVVTPVETPVPLAPVASAS